jgi:hypothetical protein
MFTNPEIECAPSALSFRGHNHAALTEKHTGTRDSRASEMDSRLKLWLWQFEMESKSSHRKDLYQKHCARFWFLLKN